MSCDVAAAACLLFASAGPGAPQAVLTPAVAAAPDVVLREPLFRDIVKRAAVLRTDVDVYRKTVAGAPAPPRDATTRSAPANACARVERV